MKQLKNYLLMSLSFWMITGTVCAQDGDDAASNRNQVYERLELKGSPSPTAASLGVYGSFPVGGFTGSPAINVPLYEINEGGYKLPISLSYNSTGIKVNDVAGWVGLGWSLNAGGVITRNVCDLPDDMGHGDGGTPITGWLSYNYLIPPDADGQPGHATYYGYNPFSGPNQKAADLQKMRSGTGISGDGGPVTQPNYIDCEPDIYFFNFNGHTGRFVFNQGSNPDNTGYIPQDQHSIYQFPYQDLDIKYTLATGQVNSPNFVEGTNTLASFTITDEEGNKYLFDKLEVVAPYIDITSFTLYDAIGTPMSGGSYIGQDINQISSWYLSKITTVLGKVITFNYTYENYNHRLPTNYTSRGPQYGTGVGCSGDPLHGDNRSPVPYAYETNYSVILQNMAAPRLSSIEGDDFSVVFVANEQRQDFVSTNALTAIQVYSKDPIGITSLIKEFDLSYYYLQSAPETATDVAGNGTSGGTFRWDPGYDKRLMLSTVTEKGPDGSTKPPYQFSYDNTIPLPSRYSIKQDFWGFFNNNNCASLIPTLYVCTITGGPNGNTDQFSLFPHPAHPEWIKYTFDGADRSTNPTALLSGTLNKITFPAGGYTQFEFEPHTFHYMDEDVAGGGLRLKKITNYDGLDHNKDVIREYTYTLSSDPTKSSGILFMLPVYAYTENFMMQGNPLLTSPYYDENTRDYYSHNLVIGSEPNYTLSGYDGINIAYSEITESMPGNGKTVRRYSTPAPFKAVSDDEDADVGPDCDVTLQGTCDALFYTGIPDLVYPFPCRVPDLRGMDRSPFSFPFAPVMNYEWNRGWLLSEKYYDNSGVEITEVNNTYKIFTPKNAGPKYIFGLRRSRMTNFNLYFIDQTGCNPGFIDFILYDYVVQYPVITQVAKVISETDIVRFDKAGGSLSTALKHSYSYNSLRPSTTEVVESDGSSVVDNKRYVTDLSLTASSSDPVYLGYQNMNNKHAVYGVVEETFQKKLPDNSVKTLKSELITYKTDRPLADKYYKLNISKPINDFSATTIAAAGVTLDPRYLAKLNIDQYDITGNVTEQHKYSDLHRVYLWNYNHQYLVAEVTNAILTDIAYTSFEGDDMGTWYFNTGGVINGTGVTGGKIYTLSNGSIINTNQLQPGRNYIVSYWSNTGSQLVNGRQADVTGMTVSGWTYYEHHLSGITDVTVSGSGASETGSVTGNIDELRLYPKGTQMSTSTYTPLIGKTSSCDEASKLMYYEYDGLDRLKTVRDQDKNILKTYQYQYQEQQ